MSYSLTKLYQNRRRNRKRGIKPAVTVGMKYPDEFWACVRKVWGELNVEEISR